MKRILLALMLVSAMTSVVQADNTAIGPQLLPFAQLEIIDSSSPYILKTGEGERRQLIEKTPDGFDALVNLLTMTTGKVLLESDDPTTLTLVIIR